MYSKTTERKQNLIASLIWIAFIITAGLELYVANFLPYGQFYSTGVQVCQDNGNCGDVMKEDLSKVDIPGWAKFIRTYSDEVAFVVIGLFFAGLVASSKTKKWSHNYILDHDK